MKKNILKVLVIVAAGTLFSGCNKTVETDVISSASIVDNSDSLLKTLSADGQWIALVLNDITTDKVINVDGEFRNSGKIERKLALYTQNKLYKIKAQYTLKAPKIIVNSPNFRITGGTYIGDLYVSAADFSLDKSSKVIGNIYFKTREGKDSFSIHKTA